MKRGHAHMKLLLRKNEVCTIGASVEVRMGKREHLFIRHWRISSTDVDFTRRKTDFILPAGDRLRWMRCFPHGSSPPTICFLQKRGLARKKRGATAPRCHLLCDKHLGPIVPTLYISHADVGKFGI